MKRAPGWRLTETDAAGWDAAWRQTHEPALTQSREYAESLCRTVRCRARLFLIHDAHGLVRGMTVTLVREVPWLGGVARINRGPVACGPPWSG
ncbi:MAG: hypothetical protein HQL96_12410, partial [Magnetococcales bacterium]|nr:hypothetical protein [Magnetococcales bacterium]